MLRQPAHVGDLHAVLPRPRAAEDAAIKRDVRSDGGARFARRAHHHDRRDFESACDRGCLLACGAAATNCGRAHGFAQDMTR